MKATALVRAAGLDLSARPHRDLTPGLTFRAGSPPVPYWQAPKAAWLVGFEPRAVRIHATTWPEVIGHCLRLQSQASEWVKAHGGLAPEHLQAMVATNGTLGALIDMFLDDRSSPIQRVKYMTRADYRRACSILKEAVGTAKLARLTRNDFSDWYWAFRRPDEVKDTPYAWTGISRRRRSESVHRSTGIMRMLRMVVRFGSGTVAHCDRLHLILRSLSFEAPRKRQIYLTFQMVDAFCAAAHRLGRPSLALATALQFETALRQKDVIGEWEPIEPSEVSARGPLVSPTRRWTSGLIWGQHISDDLVLAKPTTKSNFQKTALADLNMCPLVTRELSLIPAERRIGPVVLCEITGLPYIARTFIKGWREVARAAGIPDCVWNMDARAGAITEGSESRVELEHLRSFATHSRTSMTQHYNRQSLYKNQQIHSARVAHRRKLAGLPAEIGAPPAPTILEVEYTADIDAAERTGSKMLPQPQLPMLPAPIIAARRVLRHRTNGTTFAMAAKAYVMAGGEDRFLAPLVRLLGARLLETINQETADTAADTIYPNGAAATRKRQIYGPLISVIRSAGLEPNIKGPAITETEPRGWLQPEEAEQLLRQARTLNDEFGVLCVFLCNTGLKLSEALGLLVDDVRPSEGIYYTTGKEGKPQANSMPRAAVDALESHPRGMMRLGETVFRFRKTAYLYDLLRAAADRCGIALPRMQAFRVFSDTYAAWQRGEAGGRVQEAMFPPRAT